MGYYSYENPYRPTFPGQENFQGKIVHPQMWDSECDELIKDAKVFHDLACFIVKQKFHVKDQRW